MTKSVAGSFLVRLSAALVFPGPPSASRSNQHDTFVRDVPMDSDRLSQFHSPPGADAVRATLKRKVQRHSPDRLLRQKLVLPGGITVSAERHKGRIVVRVESPEDKR